MCRNVEAGGERARPRGEDREAVYSKFDFRLAIQNVHLLQVRPMSSAAKEPRCGGSSYEDCSR